LRSGVRGRTRPRALPHRLQRMEGRERPRTPRGDPEDEPGGLGGVLWPDGDRPDAAPRRALRGAAVEGNAFPLGPNPGAGDTMAGFQALDKRLARDKGYEGAGEHVAGAVESVSIGVCSSAGCFEFVEEWEGAKTDFETYAGKLADHLQAKGSSRAGEFKRHLVAARTFGKAFDGTL